MSRSPSRLPHRRDVSQIAAMIASSSVSPYAWTGGSGPGRSNSPLEGEGMVASTAAFCPPRRQRAALEQDPQGEVLRAALGEEVGRGVEVDVEPRGKLTRRRHVVPRPLERL